LRTGVRGSHGCERCAAEREKKGSLHTVDLRHRPGRRVVNNSDCFYLPSTGVPVISGRNFDYEAIKISPQRACGRE
jgi:hypothetical protein